MKIGLAIAALLAIAAAAPTAASAEDAIKPGKWQYTMTMQMPNMPQLPPGVKLPNGMAAAPGGMTMTHSSCVAASDPAEAVRHLQSRAGDKGQCTVERMEQSGGSVSWAMTCTEAQATVHIEGTAHYSGEQMDADTKTSTTMPGGAPMQTSAHLTGQYIGPCDGK